MNRIISFPCTMTILLLFGSLSNLSADTIVPGGFVSETWTSAGSPYLIQGNITVHADSTLNIEPGVEVNFQGYYSLTVNGLLEAVGTETDSIQFITAESMCWFGIHFADTPGSSHLAYCTVSRSGNSIVGVGAINCINSDPVITHCRISDNQSHAEHSAYAGGIALNNSNAEISWCDISNNKSGMYGGGINILNSSPVIAGCNISANKATQQGGGIYIAGNSSPIITGCAIERDTSNMYGGGIAVAGGEVTISDCTVGYNKAYDGGGGISIFGGSVSLNGCIFEHNYCQAFSGQGGGIFANSGTLTADHCTFFGDYVQQWEVNGMEIHTGGNAAMTVTNSILYSDAYLIFSGSSLPASVSYNDFLTDSFHWYFTGNIPPGLRELTQVNANGDSSDVYYNIFMEPMFVDFANGDYRLTENSPCIDAGDPNSPYDSDGTVADIGVYYFDPLVGIDEHDEILSTQFSLSQNYPNPFNPSTVIEFDLPRRLNVSIVIFNLLGQVVAEVADQLYSAGSHQVTWNGHSSDGKSVTTGVYFYRLEADDFVKTKKMLLLK